MSDRELGSTKEERLSIRVGGDEKARLEQGARMSGVSTSRFVVTAALRAAEELLADRNRFILAPDEWDAFARLLDEPARVIEGIQTASERGLPHED